MKRALICTIAAVLLCGAASGQSAETPAAFEVADIHASARSMNPFFTGGATIQVSEDFGQSWAPVEKGPRYPRECGFEMNRFWQIAPGAPS